MDKPQEIWSKVIGEGPLVALAIHDGHDLRAELRQFIALDDETRLREEDPYGYLLHEYWQQRPYWTVQRLLILSGCSAGMDLLPDTRF